MSEQMTLIDMPSALAKPTKPKPAPKPQPATETIHQTLARYAREAAAIRAQLRQAQIDVALARVVATTDCK